MSKTPTKKSIPKAKPLAEELDTPDAQSAASSTTDGSQIDFRVVDIGLIEPNEYNPNDMDAELFEILVEQLKAEGINQPTLVRENPAKPGHFLLVDGEHRWKGAKFAGYTKMPIVVVPFDEATARLRTLSMNSIRGQNIPIKLARLLVDLEDKYGFSPAQIRRQMGMAEDDQTELKKLLEIPDFDVSMGVTVSAEKVDRPISVTLMLMPDEHVAYTHAMKKAMALGGADVVALMGGEVADYDKAMKASMGLAGVKLRNVGMALICKVFAKIEKGETLTPVDLKKMAEEMVAEKMKLD